MSLTYKPTILAGLGVFSWLGLAIWIMKGSAPAWAVATVVTALVAFIVLWIAWVLIPLMKGRE